MQPQQHPVCTLFPMGPWTHRSTQQPDSEKQLPLSSFQPEISEPDMTRLSFRQLSLFVIWRPGFLETSIEFISCVCWGNTEDLSSLKEVQQLYNTDACATLVPSWKNIWKTPNLCLVSAVDDQAREKNFNVTTLSIKFSFCCWLNVRAHISPKLVKWYHNTNLTYKPISLSLIFSYWILDGTLF